MTRLEFAQHSLEGLSVGDAFGQRFFHMYAARQIEKRILPSAPWTYTDDTVMAMAIVHVLEHYNAINQNALAQEFAQRYRAQPHRGYAGMARFILGELGDGADWHILTHRVFDGMGSMGNGGAMRSAPIGAYFFDDFKEAATSGWRSAEVTHGHPEAQAGASAVAVAAAYVASEGNNPNELFDVVLEYTPKCATKTSIVRASKLSLNSSVSTAVQELGNGSNTLATDTVPFALWCAARHLGDFEEGMWHTVSGLGDRDTTCAIVGGILASSPATTISQSWLAAREVLSDSTEK